MPMGWAILIVVKYTVCVCMSYIESINTSMLILIPTLNEVSIEAIEQSLV